MTLEEQMYDLLSRSFELDSSLSELDKDNEKEQRRALILEYLKCLKLPIELPKIDPNWTWFNVKEPLTLDHFRGRLVLLDFFTYCCINCIHILPDLHRIEEKFGNDRVLIIGVHSAKFDNEKLDSNIMNAVKR